MHRILVISLQKSICSKGKTKMKHKLIEVDNKYDIVTCEYAYALQYLTWLSKVQMHFSQYYTISKLFVLF